MMLKMPKDRFFLDTRYKPLKKQNKKNQPKDIHIKKRQKRHEKNAALESQMKINLPLLKKW